MSKPLFLILAGLSAINASAQSLSARPSSNSQPQSQPPQVVQLTVAAGTPLRVVVDRETRVRQSGQPVRGKLTAPLYSFDKVVVPAGTRVEGRIAEVAPVPKGKRTLAAMNGDFSPVHQMRLEFTALDMPGGKQLPIHTTVTPGSNGVLEFVPAAAGKEQEAGFKGEAHKKLEEARSQVKQEWSTVRQLWHAPGKVRKLERLVMSRSPYRPQYIEAGTGFNATLQEPLQFGQELHATADLKAVGTRPPAGSIVRAWLATPLSSATAIRGTPVEAVLSEPLFASGKLVLPQGSLIKGAVLQARPARRLNRHGQLRIVFHEIVPPGGREQQVQASLEGIEVAKGDHLKLDSEGGAEVTTPKSVYLGTGVEIALAASSGLDRDAGHPNPSGGVGTNAANGLSGFGLVGSVLTTAARSRIVATSFGVYGAGLSVYSHFLTRGQDVVYPRYMSMVMGVGGTPRQGSAAQPHP